MLFEDGYVDIKKKFIWVKHVRIPYQRIQNVFLRQGPILRRFQLSYLYICTASRFFIIPGISFNFGEKIKAKIVKEALKVDRDM